MGAVPRSVGGKVPAEQLPITTVVNSPQPRKTVKARPNPDMIDWGSSTPMGIDPKPADYYPFVKRIPRIAVYVQSVLLLICIFTDVHVAWLAIQALFLAISACAVRYSERQEKPALERHDPLLAFAEYLQLDDLAWFERQAAPTVIDQWERAIMADEPQHIVARREHKERLAPKGNAGVISGGMYGKRPPKGGSGQSPKATSSKSSLSEQINDLNIGVQKVAKTFTGHTIAILGDPAICELLELPEKTQRKVAEHRRTALSTKAIKELSQQYAQAWIAEADARNKLQQHGKRDPLHSWYEERHRYARLLAESLTQELAEAKGDRYETENDIDLFFS